MVTKIIGYFSKWHGLALGSVHLEAPESTEETREGFELHTDSSLV